MSALMDELRFALGESSLGVTLTDTHLTIRGETGIATFVLDREAAWDAEECYICGVPVDGDATHVLEIDGGDVLKFNVNLCSDCRCPK